ncbi:oxidoreductase [Mycobacterium tuberculosis]|nr:oxidoreductase [Mycobacterium tuberculosis]
MALAQQVPNLGLARFSVQDKSILITGATGSLGRVAARALADAGARLTLAGGTRPVWPSWSTAPASTTPPS